MIVIPLLPKGEGEEEAADADDRAEQRERDRLMRERGGARGKIRTKENEPKEKKGNDEAVGSGEKFARKLFGIKEEEIREARKEAGEKRERLDRKAKVEAKTKIKKTFRK